MHTVVSGARVHVIHMHMYYSYVSTPRCSASNAMKDFRMSLWNRFCMWILSLTAIAYNWWSSTIISSRASSPEPVHEQTEKL